MDETQIVKKMGPQTELWEAPQDESKMEVPEMTENDLRILRSTVLNTPDKSSTVSYSDVSTVNGHQDVQR